MMFQRWLASACVCLVALRHGAANAEEGLTEASFNTEAAGRFAFLEFMTPNCKRCERLKPHWDRFMGTVKEEVDVMVAAVDCDGAGKSLCAKHVKAKSYPVLMYGKVGDLKPYQGPQNYDGILDHFKKETNRTCLPTNQTWCSDDEKKQIEELLAMTPEQLDALQKEKTAKVEKVMQRFEKGVVRAENKKTETSGLWGVQNRRRVKAKKGAKESRASKKAKPWKRPDLPFFADTPLPQSAALDTTGPFSKAAGMKPPFGAKAGKGAGRGAAKGAGKGARRTESPWKPGKFASKAAAKQERQALKDKTKSPAEKQRAMKEFRRQHAELKKSGSPEDLRKFKDDFMKSQRRKPAEWKQMKGDRKRKGPWSDSKRPGRMSALGASQVDRLKQFRDSQLRKIGMDLVTAVIDHKQLAEL